ncbi:hypothetical protein DAI22_06g134850 [Oryza sativa Japonica Group]|nr:hypothetical protein DAI22_06g134850 [Oryza sativa Japonica Group]
MIPEWIMPWTASGEGHFLCSESSDIFEKLHNHHHGGNINQERVELWYLSEKQRDPCVAIFSFRE